jgi:hypothetical protein
MNCNFNVAVMGLGALSALLADVVSIGHVYGYLLEPLDDATLVTSYYDWSNISQEWRDADIFPVISESALRATLGILDRNVTRGGTASKG